MKKFWEINARTLEVGLVGWLAATNVLIGLSHLSHWWLLQLLLLGSLLFLPGVACLRLLRPALKNVTTMVFYSFGLSVLVMMLSGLMVNAGLPLLGATRPLEFWGVFGAWNMVTLVLIACAARFNHQAVRLKRWRLKNTLPESWVLVWVSLVLPIMAALGAIRLNNGSDGLLAIITICLIAGLVIYMFVRRTRLPDGLLTWLLFMIGLTILLMTSLRGWDIVGHDIQREFRVYSLAHMHGQWNVALDRDPYNACLSITILPEVLARLLDTSGLFVFKVILQIMFAVTPAIVYTLLRQYGSKLAAITGSMLFVCYPTFINDSAMLTRQGVAYLFFALAILVLTVKVQRWPHKILFLLCSLGAILSHYSTAYMFVGLFGLAVIIKLCLTWWLRRRRIVRVRPRPTVLSPLFAGLLFLMTFTWYTQITATSSGLMSTLRQSFTNIPKLFSDDNKSHDTSTALLFASSRSQVDLYESYVLGSPHTASRDADVIKMAAQYMPALTSDDLPLTPLGKKAISMGFDPARINAWRQDFAKILQLLAIAAVAYATYNILRGRPSNLRPDFVWLSLASIVLLAMLVILPVLSVNYGVLRAFQQALIFLIVPIMLLLTALGQKIGRRVRTLAATTATLFLFLLFTGILAQLLGGVSPSLSMNNQGLYYGLYYSTAADQQGFKWLKTHVAKGGDVRAANFNRGAMHDPTYPFNRTGILPFQVGAGTYVYLDPAQLQRQKVYVYHDSSPLIMTFPTEYYDLTKSLIYSTSSTRVYR